MSIMKSSIHPNHPKSKYSQTFIKFGDPAQLSKSNYQLFLRFLNSITAPKPNIDIAISVVMFTLYEHEFYLVG